MAHKKSGGSARNGRESNSKRLGCKAFSTQIVSSGAILVRQRGTRFHPGENTNMGKDYTIFATMRGRVEYGTWHGKRRIISVLPIEAQPAGVLPIAAQPAIEPSAA